MEGPMIFSVKKRVLHIFTQASLLAFLMLLILRISFKSEFSTFSLSLTVQSDEISYVNKPEVFVGNAFRNLSDTKKITLATFLTGKILKQMYLKCIFMTM